MQTNNINKLKKHSRVTKIFFVLFSIVFIYFTLFGFSSLTARAAAPTEYSIFLHTNGGRIQEGIVSNPSADIKDFIYIYDQTFTASCPPVVLPQVENYPLRYGYEFLGWYRNANFSGSPVTHIATGTTGNQTFFARWGVRHYIFY